MIPNKLKDLFHAGNPVINEYAAFMQATFKYYRETRALFFEGLPEKLHQSELVNFLNGSLKKRLFDPEFCDKIQESLRLLRRLSIRMEDLRGEPAGISDSVHHLPDLIQLADAVENLYQQHWEYFRYQDHVTEEEVVSFILAVGAIERGWERFLAKHSSTGELVEMLSGAQLAQGWEKVTIGYAQEGQANFSVNSLHSVTAYLDAIYRFVSAVLNLDPIQQPLAVLHVEVGRPVEVQLSVPSQAEPAFRKMLEHLFLQDMVKRETLLKFVFEEIQRDFSQGKPLATPTLNSFQKQLAGHLKALPVNSEFILSDLTFPKDNIRVLQAFTDSLEEKKINYEPLMKALETGKKTARPTAEEKPKAAAPRPTSPPEVKHPSGTSTHGVASPEDGSGGEIEKRHIQILTDSR